MNIQTYGPDKTPPDCIIPNQTHSCNILEVKTGAEDLQNCDGLWTTNFDLTLGVKTADCAPIAFWDGEKIGIIHAGWRGLCSGIVEKMCETAFPDLLNNESGLTQVRTRVWVGPILPIFEIQPDDCYDQIYQKFGDQFFQPLPLLPGEGRGEGMFFDFRSAIAHLIPTAEFDPRSTYDALDLASWRRDQDSRRNITVIHKP